MKKLIAVAIVAVFVGVFWIELPAFAVLKGGTFNICHYNGGGTYSQVPIVFTDQATAQDMGGHLADTAVDLWPGTTYSDPYTQTNIAASHGILHLVTVTRTYTDRFGVKHTVTTTTWVVDPAKAAIYANGCVAP